MDKRIKPLRTLQIIQNIYYAVSAKLRVVCAICIMCIAVVVGYYVDCRTGLERGPLLIIFIIYGMVVSSVLIFKFAILLTVGLVCWSLYRKYGKSKDLKYIKYDQIIKIIISVIFTVLHLIVIVISMDVWALYRINIEGGSPDPILLTIGISGLFTGLLVLGSSIFCLVRCKIICKGAADSIQ